MIFLKRFSQIRPVPSTTALVAAQDPPSEDPRLLQRVILVLLALVRTFRRTVVAPRWTIMEMARPDRTIRPASTVTVFRRVLTMDWVHGRTITTIWAWPVATVPDHSTINRCFRIIPREDLNPGVHEGPIIRHLPLSIWTDLMSTIQRGICR